MVLFDCHQCLRFTKTAEVWVELPGRIMLCACYLAVYVMNYQL